jgi:hypothetical protein
MILDVKCYYAECLYAECRGAMTNLIFVGEASGMTTFSITVFSLMTLSIWGLFMTLGTNHIQNNDTLHNGI